MKFIYSISHKSFQTDDIRFTSTLFQATNRVAALNKYNKLAKGRSEYPYCWNLVKLEDVHLASIVDYTYCVFPKPYGLEASKPP